MPFKSPQVGKSHNSVDMGKSGKEGQGRKEEMVRETDVKMRCNRARYGGARL